MPTGTLATDLGQSEVGKELRRDLDVLDLTYGAAHPELVFLEEVAEPLSVD
jgi:hypothetical protein